MKNAQRTKDKPGKTPMAPELHVLEEAQADNRIARASEWQLVRWKYQRHKLAMASLVFLVLMYLGVILAELLSPYDPRKPQQAYMSTPPQPLHFIDREGRFHARPFVYGVKTVLDPITWERMVVPDQGKTYPLRFLVHGDPYKLWGSFRGTSTSSAWTGRDASCSWARTR